MDGPLAAASVSLAVFAGMVVAEVVLFVFGSSGG
jgi:hypothetical protein